MGRTGLRFSSSNLVCQRLVRHLRIFALLFIRLLGLSYFSNFFDFCIRPMILRSISVSFEIFLHQSLRLLIVKTQRRIRFGFHRLWRKIANLSDDVIIVLIDWTMDSAGMVKQIGVNHVLA